MLIPATLQRLQAKGSELDDWEPKRIERPAGVPEWGVPPTDRNGNALQAEELPPGQSDPFSKRSGKVILGPDGKPCRACNSKLAFSAAMKSSQGQSKSQETKTSAANGLGFSVATSAGAASSSCPPDGDVIGNSTWTFLHSAAAYYPAQPTPKQEASMISLIEALPYLYPCHSCAEALKDEYLREKQEKKSWEGGKVLQDAVMSGPGLRKWLCGLHNEVNERTGKPRVNCEESFLQEKWLTGPDDGSCD
jgi:hypothetical protein